MLFDTDILIWVQRKNAAAARLIDAAPERYISLATNLELIQGARNRRDAEITRSFLREFGFSVLPLTENIGHRALVYMEEYAASHALGAMDAIIAATAVENGLVLCSSNIKHYRAIKDLRVKVFRPAG